MTKAPSTPRNLYNRKDKGNTSQTKPEVYPKFDDLDDPKTILNHIEQLKNESEAKKNPFPVEVFPQDIQAIITATNESLNFPIDFIGSSLMYAVSVAIGNTHKVEIIKGWRESAVLYLSLVGKAGTNKSHPISFALEPIEQRDNFEFQKYQKEKQEYDAIEKLTKKEKEAQGSEEPVRPIWEQHLVTDFTPEALTDVHQFNKRGIGVYADELASWFKNFNRYNKGSEEQFWLSNWSGKPIRINRKTSEPTYISLPFISVIGSIQPGVLNELADNRTENGFLDRLLFVVPDNLKKEYWSKKELNPSIVDNWHTIILNLLDMQTIKGDNNNPDSIIMEFTPKAKEILYEWQREQTDQANKPENEEISGISAKIEMYALRLSLILQMMRYACNDDHKQVIGIKAVQGALKLVGYFKRTAIKVHYIVHNSSPLDKLPANKQTLYHTLPDTFSTNEGVQIAKSNGMVERTFKRFIQKRELFKKITQGNYEKLL
jgi:hypothetical protein